MRISTAKFDLNFCQRVHAHVKTNITQKKQENLHKSILPYGVSFFSILIVFSAVGSASVGSGVVSKTTRLQSMPPQPISQKQRFVLVQTCGSGKQYKQKRNCNEQWYEIIALNTFTTIYNMYICVRVCLCVQMWNKYFVFVVKLTLC